MLTQPDFIEKKIVMIFTNNGEKLSFLNDNIIVKDKEGILKLQYSCYRLFAIFIVGGVTITSGIIDRSKRFGFSIVLFTSSFKVYETISFKLEGNTLLREKQYTTTKSKSIAKMIIINKIFNQKKILQSLRNNKNKDGVELLDKYYNMLLYNDLDYEAILGIEGNAAKVYFNRIFDGVNWKGRQPRIKIDEINVLLDIGYMVLFNYVEAIVNIYGFDIYKGNLHKEFYKRKSLICDLIEPFRMIVDLKIKNGYSLNQFSNYKFAEDNGRFSLDWQDSNKFVVLILEEMIKYRKVLFGYIQSYYRWFMKERAIEDFPQVRLIKDDNN